MNSANELVVLAMRAHPKPMNAVFDRLTERPVVETDADAVEAATYYLEMQGGVRRVGFELGKASMGHRLNING